MDIFDECIVCLENNLAELRGGKLNGQRLVCCGALICKSCGDEMERITSDAGKEFTCPICRSFLPSDEKEGFERALIKAKEGRKWAQCLVGADYYNGRGVTQSYSKAFEFFSLAAAQGDVVAQGWLGLMYKDGQGCKKSNGQSFNFYSLAAEQGLTDAQSNLARCYYKGEGVDKDYEKAVHYFSLAANQGNKNSQLNVACCYAKGEGVKRSFVKAIYWFKQCLTDNDVKEMCSKAKEFLEKLQEYICQYCQSCGNQSSRLTLKCGSCFSAYYCNRVCQAKHWKEGGHKQECKEC